MTEQSDRSVWSKRLDLLARSGKALLRDPRESLRRLTEPVSASRGTQFAERWKNDPRTPAGPADTDNPLHAYFDSVTSGPGVWKWLHYFDIYHRHLARFIGRDVSVVEIGVYSGGSLAMWRTYLGSGCHIHGVDIQDECRAYENDFTSIHIGDQGDRAFWERFRREVPSVDVVIDDGGHEPEQQIVTLEELLPHMNPGGVFICEDVLRTKNPFSTFVQNLADELNATQWDTQRSELAMKPTPFQAAIEGVYLYPFVAVIEKRARALTEFVAPKHGTEWQPFLDGR